MHLGPDVILLAMKIAFIPTLRVAEVEEVTDRIEAKIRGEMPQMRKIFIEADSRGDLRGVPAAGAVRKTARTPEDARDAKIDRITFGLSRASELRNPPALALAFLASLAPWRFDRVHGSQLPWKRH